MAEVRTMREGELWWVQASGSGKLWATASAPASGLFGFVRSFNYTSAQTVQVVSDRGTPDHKKVTSKAAPNGSMTLAWTGYMPPEASGSGASVPMVHWEYKAKAPENGNTGRYMQFHGVTYNQVQFTEGEQENTLQFTWDALAMNGPTGSGYLS